MAGYEDQRGRGWRYYGWFVIFVCVTAGFAANALMINSFSLFLKGWSADFAAPVSRLQLGIAGLGICCSLISPFVGGLADRYPARSMIAVGLVVLAAMSIGLSLARSTTAYLLIYALLGPVALVMTTSLPANALVARWFVRHRGLALAFTAVGLGLAGVVMPPIIGALLPRVGWRAIWLTHGIVCLAVLLPLVLVSLRTPRASDGRHYLEGDAGAAAGFHGHGGGSASDGLRARDILGRRNFWILIVTFVPMLALYGGGGQNLAPIVTSRGFTAEQAGAFLSLFSAAHVLAMLAGGALSDRVGNRRPLAGLAFIAAAGGLLVATSTSPVLLALGAIGIGCGGAFWPLIASALAVEFGAGGIGRAFGMTSLFLPITGLVPFAVAKLQEGGGSYAPALVALAAVAVAGGAACLLGLRERRAPTIADATAGTLAEPAASSI